MQPVPSYGPDIDTDEIASESERLKREANRFVGTKEYQKAIDLYSVAIEIDSTNELLYANRSLCHLQLQQYQKAILDAETCILHNNLYEKGHYRLISSLYHQGSHFTLTKAQQAITIAKDLFPTSNAFETLAKQVDGGIESRRLAVFSRSSDSSSSTSSSDWSSQEISAWKMINEAVRIEVSEGQGASGHALPSSTFSQLTDSNRFHAVLFPGVDVESSSSSYSREYFPRNLFQLLHSSIYSPVIKRHIPVIVCKSKEILDNVKLKAIKEDSSNLLDPSMENTVIWPQILQESFAREVIKLVLQCNRKLRLYSTLNSETDDDGKIEDVSYIELDDAWFDDICDHDVGFAIKRTFLGPDWFEAVQLDMRRFADDFKLKESHGQFMWLNDTDDKVKLVESVYPAVFEVMIGYLSKLQLLANHHTSNHMKLLKPAKGSCGVVLYSHQDSQPRRYDACADLEEDSGYRLTLTYHIPLSNNAITGGELILLNSRPDSVEVEVTPLADSLVMFRSMRVSSCRRPVQSRDVDLVCIVMWISGKTIGCDWNI